MAIELFYFFQLGVLSKATASVRSKTKNLSENIPSMTVDDVSAAIGKHFLGTSSPTSDLFQLIEPNEQNFPGKILQSCMF